MASLRAGRRPIDTFSIMDDAIIDEILGAGVLSIRTTTNGAAVKAVAPMDFFLRARRDEHVVKVHVVTLVPDHANPGSPRFRLDDDHVSVHVSRSQQG